MLVDIKKQMNDFAKVTVSLQYLAYPWSWYKHNVERFIKLPKTKAKKIEGGTIRFLVLGPKIQRDGKDKVRMNVLC